MYLLDTNVVSELRRPRPHGAVLAWLEGVEDAHLHLATVTLGEIQAGIELTREQDPDKARDLETWLDQLSQSFNILPMDGPAFRCRARLMHRRSDTLYEDAMIAAIATVHQLTVVTASAAVGFLKIFLFRWAQSASRYCAPHACIWVAGKLYLVAQQ
jgi:predicted nucleic acid-binding protein